jgi:5'-nucleotidase (lipoprotein e(P4) family)
MKTAKAVLFLYPCLAAAAGCATSRSSAPAAPAPQAALPSPSPAPAALASAAAAPALPRDIHWVRDSAEYRALAIQAYGWATQQVERSAAGKPARSWAVILDADGTVLDNSQHQMATANAPHSEVTWNAWVRRRASGLVPGAAAFLARVHELGGVIAIVTNRDEAVCADTRENLRALALPVDVVLCKPPGASDKNPRFESVVRGTASPDLPPLEVLAYVGDNIRDFPGQGQDLRLKPEDALADFGRRYFVLPNPMYGSWEANPAR